MRIAGRKCEFARSTNARLGWTIAGWVEDRSCGSAITQCGALGMNPNNLKENICSFSLSATMDGVLSSSTLRANPALLASCPSRHSSSSGAWTLPSLLKQGKGGLSNVSVEELHACLQPILAGLEHLDPEALMHLERVEAGGAQLRDGYVRACHD